jgi:hypothetical protein
MEDAELRLFRELLGEWAGPIPLLVRIDDARQILGGIGRSTFYRIVADGKLKPVHQGRKPYVLTSDLIAYVRGLTEEPTHG